MILLLALIPATGLTMAGYVVLYVSGRNEGTLRTFGRYLAYWAFGLAALVVLGGVFAAGHMHREGHLGPWEMHHRWMEDERPDFDRPQHREPDTRAPSLDAPPQPGGPAAPPAAPPPPAR